MEQIASITSQGQLSIPKFMLQHFGIKKATKALIKLETNRIIVEPKKDFWDLAGSLTSSVKLTDKQLAAARKEFGKKWAEYD